MIETRLCNPNYPQWLSELSAKEAEMEDIKEQNNNFLSDIITFILFLFLLACVILSLNACSTVKTPVCNILCSPTPSPSPVQQSISYPQILVQDQHVNLVGFLSNR